jgi:hypothetical protein
MQVFIYCKITLHVLGCLSHPSSGVHQTVTAASGTGHITYQSGENGHKTHEMFATVKGNVICEKSGLKYGVRAKF